MKNLVSVEYLKDNLDNVVIIDTTGDFMDDKAGIEIYKKGHIPNAYYIDLDIDMCGCKGVHGGRHPLPEDMQSFVDKLESLGISNDTKVVVYDQGLMYAARFWWMCRYIGLDNVKVLDGSFYQWQKQNLPISTDIPKLPKEKGKITYKVNTDMTVNYQDILTVINDYDGSIAIVDSRGHQRYLGMPNDIDTRPGHIPHALNYYFDDAINQDGTYKSIDELKNHFKDLFNYKEIIVHCGSGVSGAVNILALDEIGLPAKFYIGSISDYTSYPDSVVINEYKE